MSTDNICDIAGLLCLKTLISQAECEVLEVAGKSEDPIAFLTELLGIISGFSEEDAGVVLNSPDKTPAQECFYGGLLPGVKGACEKEEQIKIFASEMTGWLQSLIEKLEK